jgi:hypothetical protein
LACGQKDHLAVDYVVHLVPLFLASSMAAPH